MLLPPGMPLCPFSFLGPRVSRSPPFPKVNYPFIFLAGPPPFFPCTGRCLFHRTFCFRRQRDVRRSSLPLTPSCLCRVLVWTILGDDFLLASCFVQIVRTSLYELPAWSNKLVWMAFGFFMHSHPAVGFSSGCFSPTLGVFLIEDSRARKISPVGGRTCACFIPPWYLLLLDFKAFLSLLYCVVVFFWTHLFSC